MTPTTYLSTQLSFLTTARFALVGIGCCLWLSACEYEELPEADYPEQVIYMPTTRNGVFSINSLSPATGTYRFTVNLNDRELVVPLGVFRSGASAGGNVAVTIAANADTVNQLINAGTLTATALLPTDKFTLPTAVALGKGRKSAPFDLRINLDYLRTLPVTPGQRLAVGVTIASTETTVNPLLKTTIISLDPAILKPTSNFTQRADATSPRRITFTNYLNERAQLHLGFRRRLSGSNERGSNLHLCGCRNLYRHADRNRYHR